MSEYSNENRGSIWRNDRKEKETQPDFTGALNVEGVEYWVSAWKRRPDAKPNSPALSFSIKRKDDQPEEVKPDQPGPGDFDDEVPF